MENIESTKVFLGDEWGINFCSVMDTCEVLGHHELKHDWHAASMIGGHVERQINCIRCGKIKYESKMQFLPTSSFHNYTKGEWF